MPIQRNQEGECGQFIKANFRLWLQADVALCPPLGPLSAVKRTLGALTTAYNCRAEPGFSAPVVRPKYMRRVRYLRELCKLHGIERTAELLAGCP